MALVNAGGHYGKVRDLHPGKGLVPVRKGLLEPHGKRRAVGPAPHAEDVPSQVDHGAFHAGVQEIRFQLIGNVALGDGAQIDGGAGIQEGQGAPGPVQPELFIVHLFPGLLNGLRRRDRRGRPAEIPEGA